MAGFAKNLMAWTGKRLHGSAPDAPPLPVLPEPPVPESASPIAERRNKRRGISAPARAGTMLTGPAGIQQPAPVARKSLLGL